MKAKSVTYKGMPIGHKDLNNGFTEVVDPVKEITTNMITTYNKNIDEFIFKQLNTDNNYVHIEKPKIPEVDISKLYSISINYRMIATEEQIRVFEDEDIIDLQDIRTNLYQYNIDYKNMTYEECSRLLRRML